MTEAFTSCKRFLQSLCALEQLCRARSDAPGGAFCPCGGTRGSAAGINGSSLRKRLDYVRLPLELRKGLSWLP
jgi:hypothetical protein